MSTRSSAAESLLAAARGTPRAGASARSTSASRTREAALDLDPHVLAVELGVLGEELAVDVGDLAHEERVRWRCRASGSSTARRRGNRSTASSTRARTSGSASSVHATPTSTSSSDSSRRGSKPGASTAAAPRSRRRRAAIGPAVSKLARERPAAVERDEAVRRLEADDPAAGGGDADRARRVGAERERRPGRRRAPRAEPPLEPPRDAAGRDRVRHGRRSAGSRRSSRTRTRAGWSCPTTA